MAEPCLRHEVRGSHTTLVIPAPLARAAREREFGWDPGHLAIEVWSKSPLSREAWPESNGFVQLVPLYFLHALYGDLEHVIFRMHQSTIML